MKTINSEKLSQAISDAYYIRFELGLLQDMKPKEPYIEDDFIENIQKYIDRLPTFGKLYLELNKHYLVTEWAAAREHTDYAYKIAKTHAFALEQLYRVLHIEITYYNTQIEDSTNEEVKHQEG